MGSYCPGLVRVNHFNRMSIVNDPILQYLDILVMDPTKVREIFATLQRSSGTWDSLYTESSGHKSSDRFPMIKTVKCQCPPDHKCHELSADAKYWKSSCDGM